MSKSKDPFHPQAMFQSLMQLTNAANLPLLHSTPESYQVSIRPSTQVARGMFVPDPLIPGGHLAHPITIRAMRKEIFMGGDGFEDLECWIQCASCHQQLDAQFWHFCPYCESAFTLPPRP